MKTKIISVVKKINICSLCSLKQHIAHWSKNPLLFKYTRPQVAQNYSKDCNISKLCNPLQAQLNSLNKMWRGNGRILFTFRLGAAPNLRLDPMIRGLVFIWTQLGARTRTHRMGCDSFSHRAIFPHPFACRLMSTSTQRESAKINPRARSSAPQIGRPTPKQTNIKRQGC